jgi:hypothetical protein
MTTNGILCGLQVVDILDPEYCESGSLPTITRGTDNRCTCCGSVLSWRVLCTNAAGDVFMMGRTCASRAGGNDLDLLSMEEKARNRVTARRLQDKEFMAWAWSKPHPKGWATKTLADDIRYWSSRYAGKARFDYVSGLWAQFSGKTESESMSKADSDRMANVTARLDQITQCVDDIRALAVQFPGRLQDLATKRDVLGEDVYTAAIQTAVERLVQDQSALESRANDTWLSVSAAATKLRKKGMMVPNIPSYTELNTKIQMAKKGL